MAKYIIHQLSLVGIGGVQQSFVPYMEKALKDSQFTHQIYGMHELDSNYRDVEKFYKNINKSRLNKLKFLYYIFSKNYIVHFYNNLGSRSVNAILNYFPSSNVIFHERGTAWNATDDDVKIYQSNASKAKIILANSYASKLMLVKRFGIDEKKIRVIYNGFLSYSDSGTDSRIERYSPKFSVGYIGRLDTPKGVNILIEAAKKLQEYDFFIAGDGRWESTLKEMAVGYDNIKFVGRMKEPLSFISAMDLIIVPSIREPLGNAVIESGFCKKPVIASNIDGIAEIIENGETGILLDPKRKLSFNELPYRAVPIPSVVVNPSSGNLDEPKEIDVDELCLNITMLEGNIDLRMKYGEGLFESLKEKFSIEKYFQQLEIIYNEIEDI